MEEKFIQAHMKVAHIYANLSHCNRRKVGCTIIKNNRVISIGYNGTPSKEDNCCEDNEGLTKPDVIHAEDNALRKLVASTESSKGADMFVTTAPCYPCATRILDAGIKTVYYGDLYRCKDSVQWLIDRGVDCIEVDT